MLARGRAARKPRCATPGFDENRRTRHPPVRPRGGGTRSAGSGDAGLRGPAERDGAVQPCEARLARLARPAAGAAA